VWNRFQTNINVFGLWKDYRYRPLQDPDAFISPEDLYRPNTSNTADSTTVPGLHDMVVSSPSPYKTNSIKLVIDWQNTGSSAKSNEEINHLVHDVLHHSDFRLGELKHFNAAHENRKANAAEEKSPFLQSFTVTVLPLARGSLPCHPLLFPSHLTSHPTTSNPLDLHHPLAPLRVPSRVCRT
jgi:hypothetical protein